MSGKYVSEIVVTPKVNFIVEGALSQLVPDVRHSISVASYDELAYQSLMWVSVISLTERFHDTVTSKPLAVATLLDQLVFQQ